MAYRVLLRGGSGEIEVKKSRFLASAHPIASEEEAAAILAGIRREYYDARHHCYAYALGPNNERQRSSDDGEPSGTAGRPILELITAREIHNALVVVTRYFGGTLLGTGGLVRAYGEAAARALDDSVYAERCAGRMLTVHAAYADLNALQHLAAQAELPVADTRFAETVEMDVIVPAGGEAAFAEQVAGCTGAAARVTPGAPVEYARDGEDLLLFPSENEQGETP